MRRRRGVSQMLLGLFAGLVFLFLLLPLAVVFPISLSSASYLQFPPPGFSWQWYQRYLDDPSWIDATIRSVKVASLCTVLAMGLGVPLSFALVRSRLRGMRIADRLVAAPIIVPTIVVSISIYSLFAQLRLIGAWYGIAQTIGLVVGTAVAVVAGEGPAGYVAIAVAVPALGPAILLVHHEPPLGAQAETAGTAGWPAGKDAETSTPRPSWRALRLTRDYVWVWTVRLLLNMVNALLLLYLYYYLSDGVGVPEGSAGTWVLVLTGSAALVTVGVAAVGGVVLGAHARAVEGDARA